MSKSRSNLAQESAQASGLSFGQTVASLGTPQIPDQAPAAGGTADQQSVATGVDSGETSGVAEAGNAGASGQPGATAAGSTAPNTPSETPVDPFVAQLSELGFSEISDPDAGKQRLLEAYRQQAEAREQLQREIEANRRLAELGRQYWQVAQDPEFAEAIQRISGKQAGGSAAPQQAANAPPATPWPNVPSYDPHLVSRWQVRKIDPATHEESFDWKPETPMSVRKAYEDHQAFVADWSHKLVHNPREALEPIVNAAVQQAVENARKVFQDEFRQREIEQEQVALQREIVIENPWVFETDARTGKPLVDPNSGGNVLSQAGSEAAQLVENLMGRGFSPREAWNFARSQALISRPQLAATVLGISAQPANGNPVLGAATTPAPAAPQKPASGARQREYMNRNRQAAPTPSRDAAASSPSAHTSFGAAAVDAMRAAGFPFN